LPATVLLRALGFDTEQMLDMFFEMDQISLGKSSAKLDLVPERMRGETVSFDVKIGKDVVVEAGRRITARHIRQFEKAGLKSLEVPFDFLHGKVLSQSIVDKETGEILANANDEITEEMIELFGEKGIKKFGTIFTNDLDHGPFISTTLRIDATTSILEAQVEIYRMMRPGEPPTKESAQNLFNSLFFNEDRYDLSGVGRMKFNKRLGRDEVTGEGILSNEDITDVLRELVNIKR